MDGAAVGWLIGGLVLGAGFVRWAAARGKESERRVLAVGLVVAGLIYVGFAIRAADPVWIAIEATGTAACAALALAGVRRSAWLLALGWALHPVWDAALHLSGAGAAVAPRGYVLVCLSFDLLVAGRIALASRGARDVREWRSAEARRARARARARWGHGRAYAYAACASRVQRKLSRADGVRDAVVNFGSERATVVYDDASTDLSRLVQVVRDAGYDARTEEAVLAVEGLEWAATGEPLAREREFRTLRAKFVFSAVVSALAMLLSMPLMMAGSEARRPTSSGG